MNKAVAAEFERVSKIRAQPLTRGWAVDLNYELYHAPDSRLRALVFAALQQAAGAAARPGIGVPESAFREMPHLHFKHPIGTVGTAEAE